MSILNNRFLIFLSLIVLLFSCNDFDKSPTGIEYKFITKSDLKTRTGDEIYYYYGSVSVLDKDGRKILCDNINPDFYFISNENDTKYSRDFVKILPLANINDSIVVKSEADSFFKFYYNLPVPGCVKNNEVYISIKVNNILSLDEYEDKVKASKSELASKASEEYQNYLSKNGLDEKVGSFGVVTKVTNAGKGREIIFGDEVTLHFEQYILDGKKIQSTYDTGEPIIYIVGGEGGIVALDFGLNGLKLGGTATIFAPYFSAFGEKGLGNEIPPYSNMMFKVEVLDIN